MNDNEKPASKTSGKIFFYYALIVFSSEIFQSIVIKERNKKVDSYLPPGNIFGGAA